MLVVNRPRLPQLGLRARSSVAFALVGLTLSLILAFVTYTRTRTYLLTQRERLAVTNASVSAKVVYRALRLESADPADAIRRVASGSASESLLRKDGQWYRTSAGPSPDEYLPPSFRSNALAGMPTRQRYAFDNRPYLAVAMPLPRQESRLDSSNIVVKSNPPVYVEVTSLVELETTLRTLGGALAAGAAVSTIIGALLGLYASRRIMRPLGAIALTAEKVEQGDLSARLGESGDPDLTRLVSSFNRMTDSLEERIQRERRFASHVSHELRSPLTSLRGAVDLVANRKSELSERAQLGVELLENDVKRFERIVLDLLEIARIEAGSASVDLAPRKVAPLLKSVLSHLSIDPALLELNDDIGNREVLVDARRFERVIANLAENAAKHASGVRAIRVESVNGMVGGNGPESMPNGEPRLELPLDAATTSAKTNASSNGKYICMHIDDDGPGVPYSERVRVFERFARGSQGRHLPGAGLGLALVTEHLRLMRGSVNVTESPELGARFTILLPEYVVREGLGFHAEGS